MTSSKSSDYIVETPIVKENIIKINDVEIKIELADTKEKHESGLMNRTGLCENCGMLFVFESEGFYPFWMKNTLISLDMIWIDSENKIISIAENTKTDTCDYNTDPDCKPQTYRPIGSAKYVLEVNAGFTKTHNIKTGELVSGL